MADFKPIETQEDFDKMIQKRLEQKEREVAERYKDYLSPDEVGKLKEDFEGKTKGLSEQLKAERDKHVESDKIIAEYKAKAEATEVKLLKNRIAIEKGIPFELSDRLIGSTEEELIKDADVNADVCAVLAELPAYKQIGKIVMRDEEFIKNSSKKIVRGKIEKK